MKKYPTTMPELSPVLSVVYRYEELDRAAQEAHDCIWNCVGNKRNAQRRFDRRTKQIATLICSANEAQIKALMSLTNLTFRDIDMLMQPY